MRGLARQQVGGGSVGAVAWVEFTREVVESVGAGVPPEFMGINWYPSVRAYSPSPADESPLLVDFHRKFGSYFTAGVDLHYTVQTKIVTCVHRWFPSVLERGSPRGNGYTSLETSIVPDGINHIGATHIEVQRWQYLLGYKIFLVVLVGVPDHGVFELASSH